MESIIAPMRICLRLAEQGRGKTGINPMVGAVLVRDGKIIAEGFHREFGGLHAEQDLFRNFNPTSSCSFSESAVRRRSVQKISSKDILYVNLEPCSHSKKKTPPCAQFLIERGIKNIVIGMKDPNPEVSGGGIALLEKSGVNVVGPILLADCRRLNRGYISFMEKGRPWVTIKHAVTQNGRIANDDGPRLMITSPEQDEWSHRFLRARHDAILVGIGTILKDDPELNVRYVDTPPIWRIILDPNFRIPVEAKVLKAPLAQRTLIITKEEQEKQKIEILQKSGVRIFSIPMRKNTFDWTALWKALTTPEGDFHGTTSILIEGGPKTWEVFRKAGMVDEEVTLIGN